MRDTDFIAPAVGAAMLHAVYPAQASDLDDRAVFERMFPALEATIAQGIHISDKFCQGGLYGFVMQYERSTQGDVERVRVVTNGQEIKTDEVPAGQPIALEPCLTQK